MKINIIILIFLFLSINTNIVNAGWDTTTEINNDTNYSKKEGRHTLLLKQKTRINPFFGRSVQYDPNIGAYIVNGSTFNSRHSLWRYRNGNTPDQDVLSWVTKSKVYRYDISKPSCQGVELFENGDTNKKVTLGDWTNKNIKARITCFDSVSGCKNTYSKMLNIGYKTIPQTTFEDLALNKNTCQGNLAGKLILIDQIKTKIKNLQIGSESFSLLENDPGKNLLANEKYKNITFKIEDLGNSTNGVSGIESYEFKIDYKKDYKGNLVNENICSKSSTYSDYNLIINGKVHENKDTKNISVSCDDKYSNNEYKITRSGEYLLSLKVLDFAGNEKLLERKLFIYPNYGDELKSDISVSSNGDQYANSLDSYTYTINLKDKYSNPIYDKNLNLKQTGEKTLTTNETNDSGDDALIYIKNHKTDINGQIIFDLKSLSPGEFNQSFNIEIKKWLNNYVNISENQNIIKSISENNYFKKPISGKFEGSVEVGIDKDFKIKLNDDGNLGTLINGNLNINKNTIVESTLMYDWNNFLLNSSKIVSNISSSVFDITGNIDGLLETPKIKSSNLDISYKLGGKTIRYYLDDFEMTGVNCSYETLGLKIIGTLQGDGKSNQTGQDSNFSDLSKSELRETIRKNAYISIKKRISSKTKNISGVVYVEGNINYSEIKNILNENDTIVVKDGNFIINENIVKSIGIIVLNDNYDVNSDYINNGNVYVNNNVSSINAMIYSDGGFISANGAGNSYTDSMLSTLLNLNGSLFTRNTIGGAVKSNTSYTLPGGQNITDYDLAETYDLNYIRKVPKSCDGDDSNDYSFIIEYNPSINSNPPKLFENK